MTEHGVSDLTDAAGAAEIVNRYLAAFYTGDFAAARFLVAADFTFAGPFLRAEGADAFFTGASGLRSVVRGHRLLRQWAAADEVCSWYELRLSTPAGDGVVPMTEWHTVVDGRLSAARVLFDTAAFRVLLPVPAAGQGQPSP
jgi:hypothetical protein